MKMLECKKKKINHIGFIDPSIMHEDNIIDPLLNKDTPGNLLMFFKRQAYKKYILWPYNFK